MNDELDFANLTHEEQVSKYKEQYIQESYRMYSDLLNSKKQENLSSDADIINNTAVLSESTNANDNHFKPNEAEIKEQINDKETVPDSKSKITEEERKKLFDYDFNNFVVSNDKHNCNDPLILDNPNPEDKVNYSNFFSSIYTKKIKEKNSPIVEPEIPEAVTPSNVNYTEFNNINFSSMKNSLHSDGYTFKIYIKKDSSGYYVNKYYYINKIYMHSTIIIYFLIFAEALLTYFLMRNNFEVTTWHLPLFLGILSLVPIIGIINYLSNKKHKIRKKFSLKNSLTNAFILEFNVILIIALLAFFVFQINIENKIETYKALYVPIIFTLNIPLYTFITALLSKSQKYYIN